MIKALLNDGWRGQDMHALITVARAACVNSGRISAINADRSIASAYQQQVEAFQRRKLLFDHVTRLCLIDNEPGS